MCLQSESGLRRHLPHRVDDLCLELGLVRLHMLLPCLLISKLSSATLLKGFFEPKHHSFPLSFSSNDLSKLSRKVYPAWMLTNLVADKSFLQVFLVPGKVLFELFVVLRVEAALLQAACSPRGNISFPSLEH